MTTLEDQIRRIADAAEASASQCGASATGRNSERAGQSPRIVTVAAALLLVAAAGVGVLWRSMSGPAATSSEDGVAAATTTESWESERPYTIVPANLSRSGGKAMLDVGAEQGLVQGVGVYSGGLIGVVDEVGPTESSVRLLGSDDVAVRAYLTTLDPLGGDAGSGVSWREGTVRTIDGRVILTLDEPLPDELSERLIGAEVAVAGGTGGLLHPKTPIGTIEGRVQDDPSSFIVQLVDEGDFGVTVILPLRSSPG